MKFFPPALLALVLAISSFAAEQKSERGYGLEAAKEDAKKLIVAEGLEATLFASEPQLVNPCDMDVDVRGRVWISEGANYRKWSNPPLRPEGDRIVILEDTNGDGAADKTSTFYQDRSIDSALGICVLGNKVIVSCSPHVFVFTDTDGDDKADKRELLFTGISGVQHDHGVHAFTFGPDGKLYFNMGNDARQIKYPVNFKECPLHGELPKFESKSVVDIAGNEVTSKGKPYRQGMAFRCNLDSTEFETLGHNFRNNYEVCVDSFGTLWQSDNDDDGNRGVRINYVMEFGNFGYTDEMTGAGWGEAWKKANGKQKLPDDEKWRFHWHQDDPGVVPNLLNTGAGSPTGIIAYEGKLLPKVFQNQVIHCDAGPRVVRAYPVTPDGAGYKARETNILTSSDSWFRPSDVCVAPDGSLFVSDWNDPGVGGHAMGDNNANTLRGRVYRVAPKGNKYSVPKLDLTSVASCIRGLESPNGAARYLAWTELHKQGAKAENELQKLWKDSNPRLRARALNLLARIPGKAAEYVSAAIKDKDADIRITGLRTARSLKLDVIPYLKQLAKDPSPQVRRDCAIALRHNSSADAPALWATLARQHDGEDRWFLEALGIAMDQQENKFFDAWLADVGDNWNTPAGRDIIWRARASKSPALIAKLVTNKQTSDAEKARLLRALDFVKGPEKEAALVEIATAGLN
jgi:putative membrane-bound dehydrogenase-like protein